MRDTEYTDSVSSSPLSDSMVLPSHSSGTGVCRVAIILCLPKEETTAVTVVWGEIQFQCY